MSFKNPFVRYGVAMFFLTGLFLGVFSIYLNWGSWRVAPEPTPTAEDLNPFLAGQTPGGLPADVDTPSPATELKNSVPLQIGEIISGVQSDQPVPLTKTPDQLRYERNVVRDFAQMLDPSVRDPEAEGNQRAKEAMVKMLLSRRASTGVAP